MAPRVGVLSRHNSKETKAILNAVADLGADPVWLRDANFVVEAGDGRVEPDPSVDVVANRLLLSTDAAPIEGLGALDAVERSVPVLNRAAPTMRAVNKFAATAALVEADVPVPRSLLGFRHDRLFEARRGFPEEVAYKRTVGTHGSATERADRAGRPDPQFGGRQAMLQRLVEPGDGDHRDRRVYVVGDEVVGAMDRHAPEGDWRTNVARGGAVADATADIDDEAVDLALRATRAVGLDYAGVDVIPSEDGWLVLEVNPTAGFKGLFEATGVSPAPHIAALAVETAGGSVDRDRVAELARTLDDGVPDCKPDIGRARGVDKVGFTERVTLSGEAGSTVALAKADTGAKRTSVDTELAAEIGAGPVVDTVRVRSASTTGSRPVVPVTIGVRGDEHEVRADLANRDDMNYPVLLGRDVLSDYDVDVTRRVDEGSGGEE